MTDYLEPRQEENEEALWEAVRRLRDVLGGPEGARTGTAEDAEVRREAESVAVPGASGRVAEPETVPSAAVPSRAEQAMVEAQVVRTESRSAEPENRTEEAGTALPLLAEAKALDRALARSEQAALTAGGGYRETGLREREEPKSLRTWLPEGRGGNASWTELAWSGQEGAVSAAEQVPVPWPREPLQAEQLDRLFRRDSRRYDGGFFLY